MLHDLRYALRTFARSPGLVAAAVAISTSLPRTPLVDQTGTTSAATVRSTTSGTSHRATFSGP